MRLLIHVFNTLVVVIFSCFFFGFSYRDFAVFFVVCCKFCYHFAWCACLHNDASVAAVKVDFLFIYFLLPFFFFHLSFFCQAASNRFN